MKPLLVAVMLFAELSACVPWTVRPIQDGDSSKSDSGSAQSASPAAFVNSIWDSKLVPAILKSAPDARTLLDALAASPDAAAQKYGHREGSGEWYFTVKGTGRALRADTTSRNGLLLVDIAPFDGKADVSIQVGPVIRGSALRDATGIIRFNDFTNQIAFADANNAINDRALQSMAGIEPKKAAGHTVEFAGAFGADGSGGPAIRGVIPVQLKDDGVRR
jgi:predicted lipoprotein